MSEIEDPVRVPRGLLGAASHAIKHKKEAPQIREELRRFAYGSLPVEQAPQSVATGMDMRAREIAIQMRDKHSSPTGDAYTCGAWDMAQRIIFKLDPPPIKAPSVEHSHASYQERVALAHHALFHDDPTDVAERLARFAEECNETQQAFGMSREDMHRLVDYTCDRPAGEPAKEIGAALLTLASLCVVAGYDMAACGEADLEKLQRPETIARIRAKRSTRHGRGPLPGLDPALTEAALSP